MLSSNCTMVVLRLPPPSSQSSKRKKKKKIFPLFVSLLLVSPVKLDSPPKTIKNILLFGGQEVPHAIL